MIRALPRRLRFVSVVLATIAALIVYRLISLQFYVDTAYFAETALTGYRYQVTIRPPRGEVYDRSGVLLATNSVEYEIGMSPVLILDRETTAQQLSEVLDLSEEELLEDMSSPQPFVLLARPASATVGQRILAMDLSGVVVKPLPRRYYPHQDLAGHILGFVNIDSEGFYGIEGFYNDVLAGQVGVEDQSRIPFDATRGEAWRDGSDLYLTIDTEIQYLAESTLQQALIDTGSQSGTILVMHPRTGEILAMANYPTFDPNQYFETEARFFENPSIHAQYEPGSTLKVLTMAIALETGTVTPATTYEDTGLLEVGGIEVRNWDRAAHGTTTMTELLAKSLNVGAATLSIRVGPRRFYEGLDAFGLGQPTGIDLQGEIGGSVRKPGNANWFESDLATNAYGQGLAVTPLQLITAIGAVANDGLIMQPHVVKARVDANGMITEFEPTVVGRAISEETARTLTQMLANALETEASNALVPGYRIAGKTGTAEIPIPGGYDPDATIASFIGYGPIDDPQFIVLVKLDRPTVSPWGSETAAPVFSEFVSRLVVLLEIPPDNVRQAAASGSGS